VLRRGESLDGWLAAVWEGRGGMGKKNGKKKEKQRKRVSAESVCTGFYRRTHRQKLAIGDSADGSDTSLNSYPGLKPSVFPSVNSSEKNPRHHAVANFKKSFSPSAIPSVYTDGIILSVNTDSF